MRVLAVCLLGVVVLAGAHEASATPLILDFEDLSDGESLTNQYAGLMFSNATALRAGISLNEFDFPPHSGVNVVFDDGGPMSIAFGSPVLSFGGFFTYTVPLRLTAFDTSHDLVATATSASSSNLGLDPDSVPNEFLWVTWASGISSVTIIGDPSGGSFTLDDATIGPLATTLVPEPTSALLLASGLLVVAAWRRGVDNGNWTGR